MRCGWIGILCIFGIMYYFVFTTPMVLDDFKYVMETGTFSNMFAAEYDQYFTRTGRSVAHLMTRVLVLSPDWLHHAAIPLFMVGIVISSIIIVHGISWKSQFKFINVFFIFALIWISTPGFGAAFLWTTGSANYSWTLFLVLFCMAQYRLLLDRRMSDDTAAPAWQSYFMPVLGICAGWTNENTGILACFFAIGVILYLRYNRKPVPMWAYVTAVAILLGFVMMMIAPGNFVRYSWPAFHAFREQPYMSRFVMFVSRTLHVFTYMWIPIAIVFAIVLAKDWNRSFFIRKSHVYGCIFLLFALMAIGALFFSPPPPLRAWTSISVFFILSAYSFLTPYLQKKRYYLLAALISLFAVISISHEAKGFYNNYDSVFLDRESLLKDKTKKEVVIPYFPYRSRYFFLEWEVEDAGSEAVGKIMADFYGKASVLLEERTNK